MAKTRKKPGPPKTKDKDPPRSLRVPNEEWEQWGRFASGRGLSISMWLRTLANGAILRSVKREDRQLGGYFQAANRRRKIPNTAYPPVQSAAKRAAKKG